MNTITTPPITARNSLHRAESDSESSRRSSEVSSRTSQDRYDHPRSPGDVSWSSERVAATHRIHLPQVGLPTRLVRRLLAVIEAQQRSIDRHEAAQAKAVHPDRYPI